MVVTVTISFASAKYQESNSNTGYLSTGIMMQRKTDCISHNKRMIYNYVLLLLTLVAMIDFGNYHSTLCIFLFMPYLDMINFMSYLFNN